MKLGSPYDREEFRDNFGRDRSGHVVEHAGRHFYAKFNVNPADAENDRLAHALSRGICNVPEVVLLTADEHRALAGLEFDAQARCADGGGTHLVRLCQDYAGAAMAAPTLTSAIAAELVFSLWVHRRDAHNGNRVYNHNVPMFFDFGAAFDSEPDELFRSWDGPGYLPNWRLVEVPRQVRVTTRAIRERERPSPFALQPVGSIAGFWHHAAEARDAILALPETRIVAAVNQCVGRHDRREVLVNLMREKSRRLRDDFERLRKLLGVVRYDEIEGGFALGPEVAVPA